MLSVTYKPVILSVILLNGIMLNAIMLSIMAPNNEYRAFPGKTIMQNKLN
jgi:hypothetical protein